MKCVNCGNEVSSNDPVCPVCGTSRAVNYQMQNSSTEAKGGFCVICGRPVPAGVKVCSECENARVVVAPAASKPSYTWIIVLCTTVAAIVIAVALLLYMGIINFGSTSSDIDEDSTEKVGVNGDDNSNTNSDVPEEPTKPEEKPEEEPEPAETELSVVSYDGPITWEDANSKARAEGGYLAVANSREEFDEMCEMIENMNPDINAFWMGVKRTGDSWYDNDDLYLLDGSESIEFADWLVVDGVKEPTGYDPNTNEPERYLMALRRNGNWLFNDTKNDVASHGYKIWFVIEKEVE